MKSKDIDQIRKVFEEEYPANVRSKDLSDYGNMYTGDALWIPPNAIDRCGIPEILEGFANTVAHQDIDPIFTAEEVEIIDDIGYVIGTSLATIHPHDGSPSKTVKYRALWLMKKESDRWKISRQIWNTKPNKIDTAEYHKIIKTYFRAFETGDFSQVKFSSNLEFLSPISGNTFKGTAEVIPFLQGVSSRVAEVNIMSITVEYPRASGVWQMKTTKGTLYTLHNFFRLDEEGLVYIWPMFDPKAVMDNPQGLIQWLTGKDY